MLIYLSPRYYKGRGALETIGTGLEMKPGDIAFKVLSSSCVGTVRYLTQLSQSIFSTLDPDTNIIIRRRADTNFGDLGPMLCAAINRLFAFPPTLIVIQIVITLPLIQTAA